MLADILHGPAEVTVFIAPPVCTKHIATPCMDGNCIDSFQIICHFPVFLIRDFRKHKCLTYLIIYKMPVITPVLESQPLTCEQCLRSTSEQFPPHIMRLDILVCVMRIVPSLKPRAQGRISKHCLELPDFGRFQCTAMLAVVKVPIRIHQRQSSLGKSLGKGNRVVHVVFPEFRSPDIGNELLPLLI